MMATVEGAARVGAVPARKRLGLLGKKLGMTQLLLPTGRSVPVTVIEAGPCVVVQRKSPDRDGYTAVQLGFASSKAHRETKAAIGHAAKAGKGTFSLLREFYGGEQLEVGATVTVTDLFKDGDLVNVTGTTKGRGFTGVIKRHGFSGFPGSHGTHEYFRHGGSIGNRSYPGRVFKGQAHGRPLRQRPRDDAQAVGRPGAFRAEPDPGAWSGRWTARRLRHRPAGRRS